MSSNIVFVGVGGAGLSALAHLFHDLGIERIVGIDSHASELTKKLEDTGICIIIGHGIYTVQQDDIVIYSDAAAKSPEVLAAHKKATRKRKRVFPPMTYFQCLGEISKYMKTIAIAGTHGKSTTTALTGTALAAHHPQFGLGIVGAPVNGRGHKNYTINESAKTDIKHIIEHILFPKGQSTIADITKKRLFAIEADEYNHHFLYLDPDYAIITNIELDHADVYGNFENYLDTFLQFTDKVRHDIFVLPKAPGIEQFLQSEVGKSKSIVGTLKNFSFTHLLGSHNHSNASLALSCTEKLTKISDHLTGHTGIHDIETTLSSFMGLRRRGELLTHNSHGVPIISDYAHHPTELESTFIALREKYPNEHITCIFQPHQARRVMEFWDQFIETLKQFEKIVIYDIYAAREDLSELKQQFQLSKNDGHREQNKVGASQFPDFKDIASITDLGNLFAQKAQATYTKDFSDIEHILTSTEEGVIAFFTAGNLDRKVRQVLSHNKTLG